MSNDIRLIPAGILDAHSKALNQILHERIDKFSLTFALTYRIRSVPSEVLPWLAHQFKLLGPKGWWIIEQKQKEIDQYKTQPTTQGGQTVTAEQIAQLEKDLDTAKRDLIEAAAEINNHLGTPFAIRQALSRGLGIPYENIIIVEDLPSAYFDGFYDFSGEIDFSGGPKLAAFAVIIYLPSEKWTFTTTEQQNIIIEVILAHKPGRSWLEWVQFIQLDSAGNPTTTQLTKTVNRGQ
jgi:P2-related tail formation protein